MLAAVYYNPYETLKIEEKEIPVIQQREILIKVRSCAICNSDLSYIDRGMATLMPPPVILGHEISGEIVDVGDRVSELQIGDHVIVPATVSCGKCEKCKRSEESSCDQLEFMGSGRDGGFVQYLAMDETKVAKLPKEYSYELGSMIANLFIGAYHLVFERSVISDGDKVVIFGSGAYGLSVLQMALLKHADVYMVDIFDWKLELAKKYGAHAVLNSNKVAVCEDSLLEILGTKADVIVDTVGAPRTLVQGIRVLKKGGQLIMSGNSDYQIPLLIKQMVINEFTFTGALSAPLHCVDKVLNLLEKNKLKWKDMITHRFYLNDINKGINTLRLGQSIRTIILPWEEDWMTIDNLGKEKQIK